MLKKRNLVSLAAMAVILTATLWVVLDDGGVARVWAAMKLARPGWLAVGAWMMVCYTAVEGWQIKLILKTMGHPSPYRHCLQFSAAGLFFSAITPSATGGQPAEVFYMARRGVPAAYGALCMLLFTIFYQMAEVAYGLWAWLVTPHVSASLGTGLGVLLGCSLTLKLLLTAGMVALLVWPRPAEVLCRWCLGLGVRLGLVRDLAKGEAGLAGHMAQYARGAALIKNRPLLSAQLLALALVQLGLRFLIPWAVYRSLGLTALGPVELTATQALISLAVGTLPIPGAVGASEWAFLTAFQPIFGATFAPTAMLLCRGLAFYLPLVVTGCSTAALHLSTRLTAKNSRAKNS